MLTVTVVGDKELIARLQNMPAAVRAALLRKVTALSLELRNKVIDKLTNKVLHVRTGRLRRSIFSQVLNQPNGIFGRVASSGDVPYAAIHEFGGTTKPHIITARKAKALAFVIGGKQVFAKVVHHPGSHIPERSFLRSSLREMRPEIETGLKEAVVGAMQK